MGTMGMSAYEFDPEKVRDLSPEVLDQQGRLQILAAAYWETTTPIERMAFGHRHGIYSFPTLELHQFLHDQIVGQKAIEIGAGNGVLARALDIPATDSKHQNKAKWQLLSAGQPPVKYGRNVTEIDAGAAVRRYTPDVVIGCWVTHRYKPARHFAGGNEWGIDEEDVLAHCRKYIVVGNEMVHTGKSIWDLPHTKITPPWLYSRAMNGTPEFIAIWEGEKA